MNIWLKLRKTAAITLCELLAIATILQAVPPLIYQALKVPGMPQELKWQVRILPVLQAARINADGPQEDLVNNNSYVSLDAIPAYDGKAYVAVNNNEPFFTDSDMTTTAFENYSDLDSLGRCGVAYANICQEIMPTEKRGAIGMVKPSGWHTVKYPELIKDRYLYNRCHLIGFQLAGENANTKNLITGTRYLNVDGMLPFEDEVADYVKETDNHVLYRVTPVFDGDNLVASGVQMEAESVEDDGAGVKFNIFCYNVQPGIEIDYATGKSWESRQTPEAGESSEPASGEEREYVLNTSSHKFHLPDCPAVDTMSEKNKEIFRHAGGFDRPRL